MMNCPTLLRAVMCAAFLASAPVHAAAPTTKERLEMLTTRARAHRDAGEFDKAAAALREALAIEQSPSLLYSLGRVYEDARKYDQARVYYELCLGDGADPKARIRAEDGLARLDKIGERGRLQVRVVPTDSTVELDGDRWVPDKAGAIELSAGPHELMVSRDDYIPHQQRVDVVGGQLVTVIIQLNRVPPQAPGEPVRTVSKGIAPPAPDNTAAIVFMVAGGACVVAGVGFQIWADEAATRANKSRDNPPYYNAAVNDRDIRLGVAIGAYIVGGAALTTGIVLLLNNDSDAPAPDSAISPIFAPEMVGAAFTHQF